MSGQTQTVTRSANKSLPYSFLATPPQKARPTQPLPAPPVQILLPLTAPPRRRSNSAISSWAALVQPGSPPPRSPRRRPSTSSARRPSLIRRPSIGHGVAASGSFINLIDTPTTAGHRTTPSAAEFDLDLTNLGYSSVFVHFPVTPTTPSPLLRKPAANPYAHIPIPPIPASPPPKRRALKHFRSLSALTRTRAKSAAAMPPPPTPKSAKAQFFAVAVAKRKKAQYKYVRPAPLANELALMQFADGGSLEGHAQRVMAHQARAAGPGVGVSAVFRDGNGGLWWDEDEEWEFAHLLGGEEPRSASDWVEFNVPDKENMAEERRGSVSTQDSDLDARYLVQPADDDPALAVPTFAPRRPAASVLALPARPRRAAKHLHKPAFLLDAAFGAPGPGAGPHTVGGPKPKGSARRRPAPLKLARPFAATAPPPTADVRGDFLAASFAPPPAPVSPLSLASPVPRPRRMSAATAPKGKPSVLNMRALFRRRE